MENMGSPAHCATGKFDYTDDQRRELWGELCKKLEALGRTLIASISVREANSPSDACKAIDMSLPTLVSDAAAAIESINHLAPLFAPEVLAPANIPIIAQYNEVRDAVKRHPEAVIATCSLHQAELMVADMRRGQVAINVEADMDELRGSRFFDTYTHGVCKYLYMQKEKFLNELRKRPHWQQLVDPCDVALDDDQLPDYALDLLRTQGFKAYAQFLTLALLLRQNAMHSRHRQFDDTQMISAMNAALEELCKLSKSKKPINAHILGMWFEWQIMDINQDKGFSTFYNLMKQTEMVRNGTLTLSKDSQARKRSNDAYLIKKSI